MKKIIIASMHKNAGKTSIIIGFAKAYQGKIDYIKPFGDRLFYMKKRLWDYDAALLAKIFHMKRNPEQMSIGFEHQKLRYMYDRETIREKLNNICLSNKTGEEDSRDIVFLEGAQTLEYGSSVNLDAFSVANHVNGELVLILSGDENRIMDDLRFLEKYIELSHVNLKGVILNKIEDKEDFKNIYLDEIKKMGIPIIGILPNVPELTQLNAKFLANRMFTKIIAGEKGLEKNIGNIFVGAMSENAATGNPLFSKKKKLIITSGDRTDIILASLESDTSCIILTNNIPPNSKVISRAEEKNIPLLLVPQDTNQVAQKIGNLEALITKNDHYKIEIMEKLVKENLDLKLFFDQ